MKCTSAMFSSTVDSGLNCKTYLLCWKIALGSQRIVVKCMSAMFSDTVDWTLDFGLNCKTYILIIDNIILCWKISKIGFVYSFRCRILHKTNWRISGHKY